MPGLAEEEEEVLESKTEEEEVGSPTPELILAEVATSADVDEPNRLAKLLPRNPSLDPDLDCGLALNARDSDRPPSRSFNKSLDEAVEGLPFISERECPWMLELMDGRGLEAGEEIDGLPEDANDMENEDLGVDGWLFSACSDAASVRLAAKELGGDIAKEGIGTLSDLEWL